MHKLVSPEGVLHLLPLDDRSILSFTKAHGLKDKKYLMKHLRGEQDESYGWQLLAKVKWLKHSSGVVIPVVGKATHLLDARAAVCERAGIDGTLMPWDAHNDDEDEDDADAASSDDASNGVASSDGEDDGSSGARQRFFCCTNDGENERAASGGVLHVPGAFTTRAQRMPKSSKTARTRCASNATPRSWQRRAPHANARADNLPRFGVLNVGRAAGDTQIRNSRTGRAIWKWICGPRRPRAPSSAMGEPTSTVLTCVLSHV